MLSVKYKNENVEQLKKSVDVWLTIIINLFNVQSNAIRAFNLPLRTDNSHILGYKEVPIATGIAQKSYIRLIASLNIKFLSSGVVYIILIFKVQFTTTLDKLPRNSEKCIIQLT